MRIVAKVETTVALGAAFRLALLVMSGGTAGIGISAGWRAKRLIVAFTETALIALTGQAAHRRLGCAIRYHFGWCPKWRMKHDCHKHCSWRWGRRRLRERTAVRSNPRELPAHRW